MTTPGKQLSGLSHAPGTTPDQRTQLAQSVLGLSVGEQVRSLPRNPGDQLQRLRRMRRMILAAGDEIQAAHTRAKHRFRCAMVTLTYRPEATWSGRHISQYLDHVRKWLARRGHRLHAVWVLELQRRGAPHYHILIWLPKGLSLPKPDKQGHWGHGSTRIEWARKPVGYLAKYASKGDQNAHLMPKGARIYGICGCPTHLGWWRAPSWMRSIASPRMRIQQRPGGWWCVEELATAWRSPWRVVHIGPDEIQIAWVGWTALDVEPLWRLDIERRIGRRGK